MATQHPTPAKLQDQILSLLRDRAPGKTICPSEVARAIAGDTRSHWEPLMQPVREAAQHLVSAGKIDVTQKGRAVDAATAKGPIRFRLR